MFELSGYNSLRKIHESFHSVTYRGKRDDDAQPIILKMLKDEYPPVEMLVKYKQEFEITNELKHLSGIIKALSMEYYRNTPVIIIEDIGGISLRKLMDTHPIALVDALTISADIVRALGEIHECRIIHKDINPSNVIINKQLDELRIIDFGIATKFPTEERLFEAESRFEGTPTYMSPEQTGKVNRLIDYRTDYYSLGVTMYELVTGTLPFQSDNLSHLIHHHIARTPRAPHEIDPAIPLMLSKIILKLLEKNPEDRYQSSQGIESDLLQCITALKNHRPIEPFVLGSMDISLSLTIPQTLYGREEAVRQLEGGFAKVEELGRQFTIISGVSGIGKTSLVKELYRPIALKQGYFISGKFEQLRRGKPFVVLAQAFEHLMRQILAESDDEFTYWKKRLIKALGPNGQVLVDLIPSLALVIGKQPQPPELPPAENQNRFNVVFHNFVRAAASPRHPLVVFLDDLQWADAATLALIRQLLTSDQISHLFFIGAYRQNEVGPGHPLNMTVEEIQKGDSGFEKIDLSPLQSEHVVRLIADTLRLSEEEVAHLGDLVLSKTAGNPFFVKEFLKSLHSENLLYVNRESCKWEYDLTKIRQKDITDNVADFMAEKIQKLPDETRESLQLAACLGNRFRLDFLTMVSQDENLHHTLKKLKPAIFSGYVVPIGDSYKTVLHDIPDREHSAKVRLRFTHDRVQQAAYNLISADQLTSINYQIGTRLLAGLGEEDRDANLYEIVNHLNTGGEYFTEVSKKDELAALNLKTARRAKESAAFPQALKYVTCGLDHLGTDSWERQYELTLALKEAAAEAAHFCAKFDLTMSLTEEVIEHAKTVRERVKAYEIRIEALSAQHRPKEAIKTGLEIVKQLGVRMPRQATKLHVLLGFLIIKLSLFGKSIDSLYHLPDMKNPAVQDAIRLLQRLALPLFLSAPLMWVLSLLTVNRLTLKHGNHAWSGSVLSGLGILLCDPIGDMKAGYEFGKLSLRLVEKYQAKQIKSRVFMVVNVMVAHWKEHIRYSLDNCKEGYKFGLETGDFEYGAFCLHSYCQHSFYLDEHLDNLEEVFATSSRAIERLGQEIQLLYNRVLHQAILNLRGEAANPTDLKGEAFDISVQLEQLSQAEDQIGLWFVYYVENMLCCQFHDYEKGIIAATKMEQYSERVGGTVAAARSRFYDSLCRLGCLQKVAMSERRKYLKRLKVNQKKFKLWAHHCPENYLHLYLLIEAEQLARQNKFKKAEQCYARAIESAKVNGYLGDEALLEELAGRYYKKRGQTLRAKKHLQNARYNYLRWGATAKVDFMNAAYPDVFDEK